jgi:c-di-GMP-binding flagellar brake protein YcgR
MQAETVTSPALPQFSAERRYPRFFLSTPLTTRKSRSPRSRVRRGITLDISAGGLSAVLCGPPPVGERVSVRLNLADTALEARAIVRHSNPSRTGFEFVNLSRSSQRVIENCIRRSLLDPWPKTTEFQVV